MVNMTVGGATEVATSSNALTRRTTKLAMTPHIIDFRFGCRRADLLAMLALAVCMSRNCSADMLAKGDITEAFGRTRLDLVSGRLSRRSMDPTMFGGHWMPFLNVEYMLV